jgi:hypothetical protein
MSRPKGDSSQRLLEQMGRMVVPLLPAEQEARLQARTAASVDRVLDRIADRRSLWRGRISGALIAAAALVVLVAGVSLLRAPRAASGATPHLSVSSGGVSLTRRTGARFPGREGISLAQGDELTTTAEARAALSLADQAAVEVAPNTHVRVAEPPDGNPKNERIELVLGEISLRVPKLQPGSTLSVRTPDAVVTVRGTRFTVGVERMGASVLTRVSVAEGRVEVESDGRTVFLTRGERWSSANAATAGPARVPTKASELPGNEGSSSATLLAPQQAPAREGRGPASSRTAPVTSPSSSGNQRSIEATSTLAEENRLYQGALRAAQNGDTARSLADLERLMRQYPRSPLMQSTPLPE